jgi:hypothetical protein
MASNSDEMVQQVQDDFQNLLADVTGPDARAQTAYTVELTLFRRLLALGAALWRLFTISAPRPTTRCLATGACGGMPSPLRGSKASAPSTQS